VSRDFPEVGAHELRCTADRARTLLADASSA
jgi:hypothetical protein